MADHKEECLYEIELSVATCYLNSDVTETINVYQAFGYSDKEWDELPEYQKNREVDEYLEDWVWQNIDTGWEMV